MSRQQAPPVGGVYNATAPTINDGNAAPVQLGAKGEILIGVNSASGQGDAVQSPVFITGRDGAARPLGVVPYLAGQGGVPDRMRGNFDVATVDTGAKTTGTFNGAPQTNYNARGAIITALLGTVTGAVTTFQSFLQWSPDGGTTWLGLTPLGANDTAAATGRTYTWIVYPTNTSQAAGTTPATLAPTTAPNQLNAINAALPRTWRWNATISVATSIIVTGVYVNYIL